MPSFPSVSSLDPDYLKELSEFVALMDEHSKDKWTLNKSEDEGIWLKQSVMIKGKNGERLNRQTHLLHLPNPSLAFNFYHRDGRPLRLDEVAEIVSKDLEAMLFKLSIQESHPIYGVPFFFIRPNRWETQSNLSITQGNPIVRWLHVYGSLIGIRLPDEVLLISGFNPQDKISDFLGNLMGGDGSLSSNRTLSKSTCVSINEENDEVDEDQQVGDQLDQHPPQKESPIRDSIDSAHDSPISAGS